MYTYAGERKAAYNAILKFGASALLNTLDNLTSYPCHVLIDRYSPFEHATSQILYTDRKCLVAALEIDPVIPAAELHHLIFTNAFGDIPSNSTIRIVTVVPTAPGGINIIYELQGRL